MGILILGCLISWNHYHPDTVESYFLDVGQGDCHVVVFPNGEGLLVDGGGSYYSDYPVGRRVVLPFLLHKRIRISWFALSHYHPDHARGLLELIPILHPREIWISSAPADHPAYQNLKSLCSGVRGPRLVPVDARFRRRVADTVIRCLHPRRFSSSPGHSNNDSQVLKITAPGLEILLTGDVEEEAERAMVRCCCPELNCDVLKVPHHGSRSSSTVEFLDCVQPRWAIFPLGEHNVYGFPHAGVVKRYRERGIHTGHTGASGGIMVRVSPRKGEGLLVETGGEGGL